MFTLTEVASLNDIQPVYRILKPWWDVFMDYLGFVMLMLAIFAGTLQLTKDYVACLPILEESNKSSSTNSYMTPAPMESSTLALGTTPVATEDLPDNVVDKINAEPKGRKTNLDYQQYIFVNQMCYHVALPWYSKYFPYLVLIHTIVLMVSSNFWFKYPKTSSKIEHFVSILDRCFESPWTTKALSETACEDSEESKQRLIAGQSGPSSLFSESQEESTSSAQQALGKNSVRFSAEKIVPEGSSMTILDKKDGEQAKALFEKVRTFRAHIEDSGFIYNLYVAQTIIKALKLIFILGYTSTIASDINFYHKCKPKIEHLTGYDEFCCTHNMAFMLRKLIFTFMAIISLYCLVCLYALFWLFRRPLKEYSFEKFREESSFSDIPDVKNDFAFLLHMVDQYDQLHSKRFGIFLSEVSENKLREISLNHEWTIEKLNQHVTCNAEKKMELHLYSLSGLPNAVYYLSELVVLKLELIPEVRISAKISKINNLQELHLYNCPAKVEQASFTYLQDHLRCLHVKFTDVTEIPPWVYLLKNLRELYLMGSLNSEHNKLIGLESMKDLRHLKLLYLKSNLNKIPTNITDLSQHLFKLVVDNDGTKLLVLNILKKMTSLRELELLHCDLERIPYAISSLTNLQELDLKSNSLQTIEEDTSLFSLKRLTCLKLWHNKIVEIPPNINHLKSLESLYLSYNKLDTVPATLFSLPKLRYLDLSHNTISKIPDEVGRLQSLQHFEITSNNIELLPTQLFRCIKLKVLCVGNNRITVLPEFIGQLTHLVQLDVKGNRLDHLPHELGQCRHLHKSLFSVEDQLFDTLPLEVKERMTATVTR
ncbi:volume-regulated anion channel subunit LRRC8D [Tachysurus fulvidraco]|uniref:volume-regulated anion channel subunit LRRC8D n=1 Tax=Tachysurus fulvidraco TaxID=1234273 RepID=UPI001FEF1C29|nr:volume-regulated anion channel subunit LRRC8D [Tachysurus fulvidraco]